MMGRMPVRAAGPLLFMLLASMAPVRLPAAEPPQGGVPSSKSFMFNSQEAGELAKALADFERMKSTGNAVEETAAPPPDVPNIYVSALAYYGEGQWTVWANGYRIVPGKQAPNFSVVSVNEDRAEIAVGGTKPARFMLHPYQTWRARYNDIVEGIVP